MKVRIYNYNFPVKASYKGWSITLHDITPFISWNQHYKAYFSINPEEYALIITQHIRSQHIPCPDNLYEKVKRNAENFAKKINAEKVIPIHIGMFDEMTDEDFECQNKVSAKIYKEIEL